MFNLNQKTVLVIGDIMLDRHWYGDVQRISPEAPVPIIHVKKEVDKLGGAANVAVNLKALGFQVILVSICGDDAASKIIKSKLKSLAIQYYFFEDAAYTTVMKVRMIGARQQLLRADIEERYVALTELPFREALGHFIKKADFCLFSDYNKGFLSQMSPFILWCHQHHIRCLVDPKVNDGSCYRHANYIKPNDRELDALLVNHVSSYKGQINEECVFDLMAQFNWQFLLHTRGEMGLSLYNLAQHSVVHDQPKTQVVCDVSGAGDTIAATFLAGCLGQYGDDKQILALSNYAAGLAIQALGTSTITLSMIANYLYENRLQRDVITKEQAIENKPFLKRSQKRVVFTNGCFDLLHPGHLRYLLRAKELGDILIVGVNTDESIKLQKHPSGPINACAVRMEMLVALECVDCVIPFSDQTPISLIEAIEPDILVKGGDYKVEDIVGYDFVTSYGGKVIALHFHDGYSSTAIRKRCHAQLQEQQDA